MTELFYNLLDLLEEEKKVFGRLHPVLKKEYVALVSYNLKMLNETIREKEIETLNLGFLEKKRKKLIDRIAGDFNLSGNEVPIPLLIGMTDSLLARQLTDTWRSLVHVVQEIQNLTLKNKNFIENSLHIVKDAVSLLENICTMNPTYFRTGKLNHSQHSGKLLCGSI